MRSTLVHRRGVGVFSPLFWRWGGVNSRHASQRLLWSYYLHDSMHRKFPVVLLLQSRASGLHVTCTWQRLRVQSRVWGEHGEKSLRSGYVGWNLQHCCVTDSCATHTYTNTQSTHNTCRAHTQSTHTDTQTWIPCRHIHTERAHRHTHRGQIYAHSMPACTHTHDFAMLKWKTRGSHSLFKLVSHIAKNFNRSLWVHIG